ncbi:MAG: hypothetical protein HY000_25275 [Planctomycetes bacterium]|nr:hypothetical protein [Planctomycetota bacterium]
MFSTLSRKHRRGVAAPEWFAVCGGLAVVLICWCGATGEAVNGRMKVTAAGAGDPSALVSYFNGQSVSGSTSGGSQPSSSESSGSTSSSGGYYQQGQTGVGALFSEDGLSLTASSEQELSNVVLEFADGSHQKFEGLTGYTGVFQGTDENAGQEIVGCWIKSGTNASGDGPGYGEHLSNSGPAG